MGRAGAGWRQGAAVRFGPLPINRRNGRVLGSRRRECRHTVQEDRMIKPVPTKHTGDVETLLTRSIDHRLA